MPPMIISRHSCRPHHQQTAGECSTISGGPPQRLENILLKSLLAGLLSYPPFCTKEHGNLKKTENLQSAEEVFGPKLDWGSKFEFCPLLIFFFAHFGHIFLEGREIKFINAGISGAGKRSSDALIGQG